MKTERGVMCEKKRKIIKIRKTENEVNNGREREREKSREGGGQISTPIFVPTEDKIFKTGRLIRLRDGEFMLY